VNANVYDDIAASYLFAQYEFRLRFTGQCSFSLVRDPSTVENYVRKRPRFNMWNGGTILIYFNLTSVNLNWCVLITPCDQ
jgi:hypothetical protein